MLLFIFHLESVVFCYCFVLINILREGPFTFFYYFPPKNLPGGKGRGGGGGDVRFSVKLTKYFKTHSMVLLPSLWLQ